MIVSATAGLGPGQGRALPIDHLRTVLVILVLVHHAVLAYHPYVAPPTAEWDAFPREWRAFPVVDTAKAPGVELLVGFNDVVLMSLLFLLAGLFTWKGLQRKGALTFLRDRGRRLGLPFVACAAVLAPLAYYPAYLQYGGEPGLTPYVRAWISLPGWPTGPAWFLWVLLAFSALAALSFRLAPRWGEAVGAVLGPLGEKPWRFFALLVAASALAYMPLATLVNPMTWFELGPFTAQTARLLHYALYFVFGIALGAYGVDRGLFARDGRLARRWAVWQGVAGIAFMAFMVGVIVIFMQLEKGVPNPLLIQATNFGFALSCAASSLMFISFFARFGHWAGAIWRSLDRSSYGMYLVHYVFSAWLQQALLPQSLPGYLKAATVILGTILLSWGTTILLRRIPALKDIL